MSAGGRAGRSRFLAPGLLLTVLALLMWSSTASAAPVLRVHGKRLYLGSRVVQLRGVSRSGTEYACIQGWGLTQSPDPARIDSRATVRAMRSWDIDIVRVPLNEDCWLGINAPRAYSGSRYRQAIIRYVRELGAAHLFVLLDLHWAAPGRVAATRQLPMADADHAPTFWRSVAKTFRADPDVLFDLYNEPFGIGWSCWLHGCEVPAQDGAPAYRAAGMQTLVDAVRSTGARQPLVLGGLDWAGELDGWLAHEPRDPRHALIASVHSYGGLSPCAGACLRAVARTAAKVPVIFGEMGETDCADDYVDPLMRWADARGIGYLAWAWDPTDEGWSCSSGPSLVTDLEGNPTAYGAGIRAHFRALGRAVSP